MSNILRRLDLLVKAKIFLNRSKAIQEAIKEKLHKLEHNRLEVECSKLNPDFEQALAEEGLFWEMEEWPADYESASLWSYIDPTPYSLRRINLSRDGLISCISGFFF